MRSGKRKHCYGRPRAILSSLRHCNKACGGILPRWFKVSLFTWRISLWPNCGCWLIVAFYLLSYAWDCGFEWPCWRGGPEIKSHNLSHNGLWFCSADVGLWCQVVTCQVPIRMQVDAGQGDATDVTTKCMLWVCHCDTGMTSVYSLYGNRSQIDQSNYFPLVTLLSVCQWLRSDAVGYDKG